MLRSIEMINVFSAQTMSFQFTSHIAHHDFRAADHGDRARRLQAHELEQSCDYTDVPAPTGAPVINRDQAPEFLAVAPS